MSEQISTMVYALPSWRDLALPAAHSSVQRRVLIITPNREQARTLGGLLWLSGFEAVGAPDVASGLTIAAHIRPDAVVVDTTIPQRDAQALCALLRRWRRAAPIVALGACLNSVEELAWLALGVEACCTSLPDAGAIVSLLDQLLPAVRSDQGARPALLPALLAALEAHAPDTAAHCRRVAALAGEIGHRLGLDRGALDSLVAGALLHDIGKLRVPRAVLQKPGPLDTNERAAVNAHPLVGLHILAPAQLPADVLEIVRSHHERLDGAGYPDRLAGDAIPLLARIVAVADTFDAMTARRPYRAAMSPTAALASISAAAGRHYDPQIVAALAEYVGEMALVERCVA